MIIKPADRLQTVMEYYFSKKLQEIRELNKQGRNILNLGIGSPDMMPSEETIEALISSVRNPSNHGYQPYRGISELREAIAHWVESTYRLSLDPDSEILPLMGSKEGITHISLAFLNPGDRVLVPELGYPAYKAVSEMVGAIVETYPLVEENRWEPDFKFLEKKDLSEFKLMWINYPHMPTGAPASLEVFEKIVDLARKKIILICHDNPYSLVLNETAPISFLSAKGASEVGIELNSFSKSHNMAGWRVGWLSGSKAYLDEVLKIKSNFDSGMFRGIQDAAVAALRNPIEWHKDRNRVYSERRQAVFKILSKLKASWKEGQVGLFIWARVNDNIEDVEKWIDRILYEHNVFITPGFIFGSKGDRFIRISLCSDISLYDEALKRLANFKY
jgi:aspartate/methionine/tyrosine aminotransferase